MENDPKGLIFESYNMEGITLEDCRIIFFGWVLDLNEKIDTYEAIKNLLDKYEYSNPQHPMTIVLREGMKKKNTNKSGRVGRKNKLRKSR